MLLLRYNQAAMAEMQRTKEKRAQPPLGGVAVAGMFWLWGVLAFYTPAYLGIGGRGFAIALGTAFIAIGFAGAFTELSKLQKNEAWGYWGASLVFLVPAAVLHTVVSYQSLNSTAEIVARTSVLCLVSVGGAMFLYGIAHFFWLSPQSSTAPGTTREPIQPQTIASVVGAALTITAIALKLVLEINK